MTRQYWLRFFFLLFDAVELGVDKVFSMFVWFRFF